MQTLVQSEQYTNPVARQSFTTLVREETSTGPSEKNCPASAGLLLEPGAALVVYLPACDAPLFLHGSVPRVRRLPQAPSSWKQHSTTPKLGIFRAYIYLNRIDKAPVLFLASVTRTSVAFLPRRSLMRFTFHEKASVVKGEDPSSTETTQKKTF